MARVPRDPEEAVGELGIAEAATVVAVGPADGYVEALADAVGTKGTVIVQYPPPDLKTRKKAVKVVEALPEDAKGDAVVAWVPVVQTPAIRELTEFVADGGALWVVLPRGGRDTRAPITEGELKRNLLPLGFRQTRALAISSDAHAVRFHRRR